MGYFYDVRDAMSAWRLDGEFGIFSEIKFLGKLKKIWIEKMLFGEKKPLKQVMREIL